MGVPRIHTTAVVSRNMLSPDALESLGHLLRGGVSQCYGAIDATALPIAQSYTIQNSHTFRSIGVMMMCCYKAPTGDIAGLSFKATVGLELYPRAKP